MNGLPVYDPPAEAGFAAPFWEAIAAGELRVPRCSVCGTWLWYPDEAGTCCAGGVLQWERVSGAGTVHTYTTVRRAFLPDGTADVPFHVVFVDLDDAPGVRLIGNMTVAQPVIGMRVTVSFADLGARRHPVFEPAD